MSNKFSNYKIYVQLASKVHKNYKKNHKFNLLVEKILCNRKFKF